MRCAFLLPCSLAIVACSSNASRPDAAVVLDRPAAFDRSGNDAPPDAGRADRAATDGARDRLLPSPDGAPLKCFELSLDPDLPLAIDGVFDSKSAVWRRPYDDPAVCPATALLPAASAAVPYVAYAFCNKDSKAHTFDFEMMAQAGPKGEPELDDPYLVLYQGQGIPTDPLKCLAVNDDIPDAIDTKDSEVTGVKIPAGGAVTMVGTTFEFDPAKAVGTGGYILVVTVNDP